MSSPSVAGHIACLLSAWKQNNIPVSPYRVRLAIENSALLPVTTKYTKLDIGQGLIQLNSAFDLTKHLTSIPSTLNGFKVSVTDNAGIGVEFSKKGIYLREPYLTEKPQDFIVTVQPSFKEQSGNYHHLIKVDVCLENSIKIDFERRITLACDAPYVQHTDHLFLTNHSTNLQVRVDPTSLAKGLHVTEIVGFDNENRDLGPLFRVPITVIIPEIVSEPAYLLKRSVALKAGEPVRTFIKTPAGASYARFKLKSQSQTVTSKVFYYLLSLLPNELASSHGTGLVKGTSVALLVPGKETSNYIKVIPERTIELSLVLSFANVDPEETVDFELEYFGGQAESPSWVGVLCAGVFIALVLELQPKRTSAAYLELVE